MIHRNKAVAVSESESRVVDVVEVDELERAEIERDEVVRAASAGKLSELESKRLKRHHLARLQTIRQLRFLAGRALELDRSSFEFSYVSRAVSALLTCSSHLVFEVNEERDFARLKSGRFCRVDRLCACCARLRAAKLVRDYGERATKVFKRHAGEFKPVHVVLTVRNGPDFIERFEMLRSSWATFLEQRRNVIKAQRNIISVFSSARAGVGSVEIKRGRNSGLWHPHLHAVLFVPVYVPAAELELQLRREWEDVTGGDSFNVHVGEVHAIERGERVTVDAMRSAFVEVFKYATKGDQMEPADSYHAWLMLRARRLIQSFGELRGHREPADLGDVRELLDFDTTEREYVETPGGYVLAGENTAAPRAQDTRGAVAR